MKNTSPSCSKCFPGKHVPFEALSGKNKRKNTFANIFPETLFLFPGLGLFDISKKFPSAVVWIVQFGSHLAGWGWCCDFTTFTRNGHHLQWSLRFSRHFCRCEKKTKVGSWVKLDLMQTLFCVCSSFTMFYVSHEKQQTGSLRYISWHSTMYFCWLFERHIFWQSKHTLSYTRIIR